MNISQAQLDFLRTTRVHFCIPCYGGMVTEAFFISMLKFMAAANRLGLNFTVDTMVNESLIPRGRNSLVAKFMAFEPKSTHLMFIDADIGFEPEEVLKLILANKDVCGGLYPKKSLPISYVVNKVPNSRTEGNLVTVSNLGTGFMLIKREVLEKLMRLHPNLHYCDDIGLDPKYAAYKYGLFNIEIDPVTKELLSEDYYFCKLWRQAGGDIWADLSVRLDHTGYFKFQGDASQLAPHL
jgi:hypothetical protein